MALLADPSIVDFDTTDAGSEASNLLYTLRYIGTPVTTIDAIDSATVAAAPRDKSALSY